MTHERGYLVANHVTSKCCKKEDWPIIQSLLYYNTLACRYCNLFGYGAGFLGSMLQTLSALFYCRIFFSCGFITAFPPPFRLSFVFQYFQCSKPRLRKLDPSRAVLKRYASSRSSLHEHKRHFMSFTPPRTYPTSVARPPTNQVTPRDDSAHAHRRTRLLLLVLLCIRYPPHHTLHSASPLPWQTSLSGADLFHHSATNRMLTFLVQSRPLAQVPVTSPRPTRVMCGWRSATSLRCPCLPGRRSPSGWTLRRAQARASLLSEPTRRLGYGWRSPCAKRVFSSYRPSY